MGGVRQFVFGAAVAAAVVSTFVALTGSRDVAPAAQAGMSTQQLSPYLRFTGTGTVQVKPDTASISFSTSGEDSSKAVAVNDASAAMRRVIASMVRHGIAHGDLQTSTDVYQDSSRGVYDASESLQVTVHGAKGAGELVADGLKAGADSSSGPDFSISDHTTGYVAALRAAMADARAHAEAAAEMIHAHVTGVVSVDDTAGQSEQPIYGYGMRTAATDSVGPVPTEHGTQPVTATVTVEFSYAPA
jgi:uncharacterized protein